MAYPTKFGDSSPRLGLNLSTPLTMHLDINSCFATLEQQANPLLRGVPLAVAAYNAPYGCILASSVEAKLWGVKTGMTVGEGKKICPLLVVREADPNKYRFIHQALHSLLAAYSEQVFPKSIDEFVIDFARSRYRDNLVGLSRIIKTRIRQELGDWIGVSIGLGPNRFLAKLGADTDKPDGLQVIDHRNLTVVFSRLNLTDFCGLNHRLSKRLKEQGIFTPKEFLAASLTTLKGAFRSVVARDWYLRVRGYEVDGFEFARRSFGQSYVLPHPLDADGWLPILAKLVDKAARRMRAAGFGAKGVHLYLSFGQGKSWGHGHQGSELLFTTHDLLSLAHSVYRRCPLPLPVKQLAVSFFGLNSLGNLQLSLMSNALRIQALTSAVDQVNARFGPYTLCSASMLGTGSFVPDRIAFGQ